ncbi:hypothetical protein HDU76_006428, partial [Blyttiomyces sp. JEL0837]
MAGKRKQRQQSSEHALPITSTSVSKSSSPPSKLSLTRSKKSDFMRAFMQQTRANIDTHRKPKSKLESRIGHLRRRIFHLVHSHQPILQDLKSDVMAMVELGGAPSISLKELDLMIEKEKGNAFHIWVDRGELNIPLKLLVTTKTTTHELKHLISLAMSRMQLHEAAKIKRKNRKSSSSPFSVMSSYNMLQLKSHLTNMKKFRVISWKGFWRGYQLAVVDTAKPVSWNQTRGKEMASTQETFMTSVVPALNPLSKHHHPSLSVSSWMAVPTATTTAHRQQAGESSDRINTRPMHSENVNLPIEVGAKRPPSDRVKLRKLEKSNERLVDAGISSGTWLRFVKRARPKRKDRTTGASREKFTDGKQK